MKKYILPIILILFLAFTLSGYSADLYSTYDQRIKLTVSNTNIDAELTHFPLLIKLTSTQMEEVFTEFDSDDDFDRCAITTSDESTQIYGDCERFDDSEQVGEYHAAKTGVAVSNTGTTDFYFYYDKDADHNTTYISKSGDTAAQSVWDSNFKAVYHMVDATTSTLLDSTSNNNDGTKKGANEPVEAAGKVGQGQDFDGTDDYINLGTSSTLQPETGSFTVEAVAKTSDVTAYRSILECRESGNGEGWKLYYGVTTGEVRWSIEDHNGNMVAANANTDCSDGNYHYIVGIRDIVEDELTVFLDGVEDVTPVTDPTTVTVDSNNGLLIGCNYNHATYWYNDVIDEIRISKTRRSNAWIKATKHSLWDNLLTYGDEETEEVSKVHVFFTFSDF